MRVHWRNVLVKRFPVAFFFERLSWTEEIHANKSLKRTFLSCINEQIYMSLRKSSKRTNPEWHFKIFTFASQRRLVELLSYGEYNHIFISVICFLKATNLSVHRFQWLTLHYEKIVHLHYFSALEIYWSQQRRFENTE